MFYSITKNCSTFYVIQMLLTRLQLLPQIASFQINTVEVKDTKHKASVKKIKVVKKIKLRNTVAVVMYV